MSGRAGSRVLMEGATNRCKRILSIKRSYALTISIKSQLKVAAIIIIFLNAAFLQSELQTWVFTTNKSSLFPELFAD
jgi:hypothetical protein